MALYEVFAVGPEVRRMVIDRADGDKIQRYAVESGMITLRQCGFRQAARGLTTLEEVLAVAADTD
jgi:type II secretory ATPase GspE/PulE/Tfp pilus assembly ATPase PilB-like protein